MTSNKTKSSFEQRINRVLDYISQHLDENLRVDELSKIAHFSSFHFHRQFTSYTGISVIKLVQLMRLKRASFQLVFNRQCAIGEIAFDAGFENPESFSRAFKRAFGQTPSEFRVKPAWEPWMEKYKVINCTGKSNMEIKIVTFSDTRVAALEHTGAHERVYDTSRKFIEWRKANGVSPASSKTFGIHYNDHRTVAPQEYRFDICASYAEEVKPNSQGVIGKVIPGGRCATFRHHGSREHIEGVDFLYGEWLADSEEELRGYPPFFHYVNVGPDVAEHEMITDVYAPLK